jgi:hypothetical protein
VNARLEHEQGKHERLTAAIADLLDTLYEIALWTELRLNEGAGDEWKVLVEETTVASVTKEKKGARHRRRPAARV